MPTSDGELSLSTAPAALQAVLNQQRALLGRYSRRLADLSAIEEDRDRAVADRDQLLDSRIPLEEQRDALVAENAALRTYNAELEERLRSLEPARRELEEIRSSRTWTLTAPVRSVVSRARLVWRGRP